MPRLIALIAVAAGLFASASCDRHDPENVKYFFTQQLPKERKAEMKERYRAILKGKGDAGVDRAEVGPARTLFPDNEM